MRAESTQASDRCSVSKDDIFQVWLKERKIEDVEAFVPDMAGSARGKVLPADKFGSGSMKMPEAIFAQTISGDYVVNKQNVEDRDMLLVPDSSTLRPVPWASDPAASVFLDCFHSDGSTVEASPRSVLRSVLAKYEARGWEPVVAPEVEFYLLTTHSDPNAEAEPPEGRLGWTEGARQPYSIDTMNDFEPFINDLYKYCEDQGIRIDTLSQEMGPAQFEINFLHGNSIELADQVFLFKRTVREVAIEHEMHATFLAKPMAGGGQRLACSSKCRGQERRERLFDQRGSAKRPVRRFSRRPAGVHAARDVDLRSVRQFVSPLPESMGVARQSGLGR